MVSLEKFGQIEATFQTMPPFVQQHSMSVGHYADVLVKYILDTSGAHLFTAISLDFLNHINALGRYHDIGKAAITDAVINSDKRLSHSERTLIFAHTLVGAYFIRDLMITPKQEEHDPDLWDTVAQCCQYHHERWDGKGYPFGLAGNEIPLLARIIGIADAYDAMTADRPYHKGISETMAIAEIRRSAGTQFDPVLADIFCEAMQQRGLRDKEISYEYGKI